MDPEMQKQSTNSFGFSVLQVPVSPPTMHTQSSIKAFLFIAQMTLRILVIAFTLAGAITMITSDQSITVFGIAMDASYNYSASFKFNVAVNFVVCGLCLQSVVLAIVLNRPKSNPKNYFYLLLHDLVNMLLLLSGVSAATAIGYVGRFGQQKTGWIAICDRIQKFCDKIMVSIVLSFLAVIFLLLLTVISAYKLKSLPN